MHFYANRLSLLYYGHMPLNNRARLQRSPRAIERGNCACASLRKASRRISQFYDTALAPVGIKCTQFAILAEIDYAGLEGSLTMRELAAAMVMDRSTLGHNLRPLERHALLTLRTAPDDRRKRYVELTKKGKDTLGAARRAWRHAEGCFEKIFGKQSAADLRAVLLGIAGNEQLNSLPIGEKNVDC
jgi:DNA-binding MarR family transcriptional regulator